MENDPVIFDPYSRPPDRLNEVEPMILGAASAGGSATATTGISVPCSLDGAQQGRMVPVVPGVPLLLARNTKSEVLLVIVQSNTYGPMIGRFGKGPDYLTGASCAFDFSTGEFINTLRQVLLAKEELWGVIDATLVPPTPTHMIVSEVTP